MESNPNFKFDITLSNACYKQKPTAVDYRRMSWKRVPTSLSNFINSITAGYSYCHIYHGNRRIKSKFLYTQVVSIDVDDTNVELHRFISVCTLKPTFAYETFSNGKDGKFSYCLVFVFKEHLNSHQFVEMYDKLCRMTNPTDTKDHCGKVLTQLMNGTTKTAYVYRSNNIYSAIDDLPIDSYSISNQSEALFTETIAPIPTKLIKSPLNSSIPYNNINISHNTQKQYKPKEPFWKELHDKYGEALDMLLNDRQQFLDFYHQIFKVTRWAKIEYNDSGYCVIPDDLCHYLSGTSAVRANVWSTDSEMERSDVTACLSMAASSGR